MKELGTIVVGSPKEDMLTYTPSYKYKDMDVDICLELGSDVRDEICEFFKRRGDEIARQALTNMLKDGGFDWNDVLNYNISADVDSIENVFRIHGTIGVKLGKGSVREP